MGSPRDGDGITRKEEDAANALSGNALELMALALSALVYESDTPNVLKRIDTFADAILESTDPLSPWNVRHSAAVAILSSGILSWKADSLNWGEGMNHLQRRKFDLYMVALKFLEDNDSDVRQAAGKALTNATVSKSIESNQYDANNHISDVSLKVLEGCGVILSSDDIGSALITHLFNILLEKCETIRGATLAVLEEFGYSERATSSSTLLNLSTKRKIFEDEEPNPFEEVRLWRILH